MSFVEPTIFYKLRTGLREGLTLADPGQEWLILPALHRAAVQYDSIIRKSIVMYDHVAFEYM